MTQPWALQLHISKHRSYRDVVMAPALADAATLGAATRLEQGIVHLFVDHSCLDVLQQQFTLGQGQAEGFYRDAAALEFSYLLHLLVVGVADSDQLETELHARPTGQPG
jgi:hypothetical protein